MKTVLPKSIKTVEQAKEFLTSLHLNKEHYHPEDRASDCLKTIVTPWEADRLDQLMDDIYHLPGNDGRHCAPMVFDPCEWLLDLDYEVGSHVALCEPPVEYKNETFSIVEVDYETKKCKLLLDGSEASFFETTLDAVEFY